MAWRDHFGTGREPALPPGFPAAPDPEDDPVALNEAYTKRPGFVQPATRDAVYETYRRSNRLRVVTQGGQQAVVCDCISCGQPGHAENMQLGHRTRWADHARALGALTADGVRAAFHDLDNLAFEHQMCNVSHLFEELSDAEELTEDDLAILRRSALFAGLDDEALRALTRAAIFDKLRSRIEDEVQELGSELQINGRSVIVRQQRRAPSGDALFDPATATRPSFFKTTHAALMTMWEAQGWVEPGEGGKRARCGSCGNWGEAISMQLGHIQDWKAYIQSFGPVTQAQATNIYNDLMNLKFEHPLCNQSHEWEELAGLAVPQTLADEWLQLNSARFGADAVPGDQPTVLTAYRSASLMLTVIAGSILMILRSRGFDGPFEDVVDDGQVLLPAAAVERVVQALNTGTPVRETFTIADQVWPLATLVEKLRHVQSLGDDVALTEEELLGIVAEAREAFQRMAGPPAPSNTQSNAMTDAPPSPVQVPPRANTLRRVTPTLVPADPAMLWRQRFEGVQRGQMAALERFAGAIDNVAQRERLAARGRSLRQILGHAGWSEQQIAFVLTHVLPRY